MVHHNRKHYEGMSGPWHIIAELGLAAALALGLASSDGRDQDAHSAQLSPDENTDEADAEPRGKTLPAPRMSPFTTTAFSALPFDRLVQPDNPRQVRIERRVIIRISPQNRPFTPMSLVPQNRREGSNPLTVVEEKHGNCLEIGEIKGARPNRDGRLMLFMSDSRTLALKLDKSCPADAFYSGFYVERPKDGKLCMKRDLVQSRSGARCEVRGINRLVVRPASN